MKIDREQSQNGEVELPRPPVSSNNEDALEPFGEMVVEDYREFKKPFMEWLMTEGKDTYRLKGYSKATTKQTHYKIDEAYRWKWNQKGEYTTEFTVEDATELIDFMVRRTSHPDRYVYGFEKSVRRLFKYLRNELNRNVPEWDHDIPIEQSKGTSSHIKDKFKPHEMNGLYEAALKKYSLPSYYNKSLSDDERDSLKALVSQRLGKPKKDVAPEDFTDASSWKVPSMVAVCSDTGLRPIEVGRTQKDWFDLDNGLMVVPADESTKNRENWECWLSDKTANAVGNWMEERQQLEKYHGRDELWLTRKANPYGSGSLNKMLNKLMEEAEIDSTTRKLSWYSFRHGAASLWAEEEDLSRAQVQLRHKTIKTTQKYVRNNDGRNQQQGGLW